MPPKKKDTSLDEEDITFKIFPLYKRKCDQMGIMFSLSLKELLDKATEANKFEVVRYH